MRLSKFTAFLILPLFVLGTAIGSAAPYRSAGPDLAHGIVAGTPHVAGLRDVGRAAPSQMVSIAVVLKYHNQSELEQLVRAQSNVHSPLYHRYLTPAQFTQRYAPTPQDYARAIISLQRGGFVITQTYPNRTVIDAKAPAIIAERYFGTQIHQVTVPGQGVRYANATAARVPAGLNGILAGVAGLDNIIRVKSQALQGHRRVVTKSVHTNAIFGPDGGYGPQAFQTAYTIPFGLTRGAGGHTGNVIDSNVRTSDVHAYLTNFGINLEDSGGSLNRRCVDQATCTAYTSDQVEATLDTEVALGIAPATNFWLYIIPSLADNYILDAYSRAVTDHIVQTVNSSFGACENNFTDGFPQLADQIAVQGAGIGQTFDASTGDAGAFGFFGGCAAPGVSAPADGPHFVAVGGTSLYIDPVSGAFLNETAWSCLNGFCTGGGVSSIFPEPSYQVGIPNVIPSGRNMPDLAFDGDPGTGASFYLNGAWSGPIGGTSLSAVIFGAALTVSEQVANVKAGFFNPYLYAAYSDFGYGPVRGNPIFRDITTGSNGYYFAKPGYDQVTGIGALLFGNAVHAYTGR